MDFSAQPIRKLVITTATRQGMVVSAWTRPSASLTSSIAADSVLISNPVTELIILYSVLWEKRLAGGHCYASSKETCFENRGMYYPIACTKGLLPCGFDCFDPKKEVCLDFDYYGQ